jgi:hypothetical protein
MLLQPSVARRIPLRPEGLQSVHPTGAPGTRVASSLSDAVRHTRSVPHEVFKGGWLVSRSVIRAATPW